MGFFEHQRLARRNSVLMVLLFGLAVVAVVAAVDLALAAVWVWSQDEPQPVPRELYIGGAAVTGAVILLVSLFNIVKLSDGGAAVARMVGARPVAPGTTDPLERRLRNVVEEMALAAGVRVPDVYVMDAERGINAFAAGWSVSGAAVAVTRGTLEALTRDELQGVVGHEFSHILNGDMRLNIRMIGVLAGIVFIGSIGLFVLRSVRGSRNGKGTGAIMLAGLALLVIGYVGMLCARLIKAGIARQREFLADASSVQFTRNPEGIAGALDQIRVSSGGALVESRYAEELSHMFFGQSVKQWLGGIFATHPPLDERIRRVHPGFRPTTYRTRRASAGPAPEGAAAAAPAAQPQGRRSEDLASGWGRSAAQSAQLVGMLDAGQLGYAKGLLASLPAGLREVLRDTEGARAVLLALLLAGQEQAMALQLEALRVLGADVLAARARSLEPLTRGLGAAYRLPVIDLALPAVKAAPQAAKQELLAALEAVINADRRVSLHEFVVLALAREQLAPAKRPPAQRRLGDLQTEAGIVLTLVAHAGTRLDAVGGREAAVLAALRAGEAAMKVPGVVPIKSTVTLQSAGAALEALKGLAPMQKALLIEGLFAAVTFDGTIRVGEAELMRLLGAALDCPLPPLLASLDPAALAA